MCTMNLYDLETSFKRSACAILEMLYHFSDIIFAHRSGKRIIGRETYCAWSDSLPTTFSLGNLATAIPRTTCAGFSPCMCKLDSGNGTIFLNKGSNTCQHLNMLIAIDAQIL